MAYDPAKHHRRSIRLSVYDYAQAGAYFVTIVTQGRARLFGEVRDGRVRLNDAGKMIETAWRALPERYPGVALDAIMVMPNHVHGIIVLAGRLDVGAGPRARPTPGRPQGVAPTQTLSLPDVVQRFKSLATAKYRHGVHDNGWPPFDRRLWQRNYYEHVVRGDRELDAIREYIVGNPHRWPEDPENPDVVPARGRAPVPA